MNVAWLRSTTSGASAPSAVARSDRTRGAVYESDSPVSVITVKP